MPKKRPPNAERTQFKSGAKAVESGRKGGKASGEAKRKKKTIQKILSELLDGQINDSPQFAKLAQKMGVASDKSVKEIFTMVCLLNSVKSGSLADLERLTKLLGEEIETKANTEMIGSPVFESTEIVVLPSAKEGEDVILPEREAEDDARP